MYKKKYIISIKEYNCYIVLPVSADFLKSISLSIHCGVCGHLLNCMLPVVLIYLYKVMKPFFLQNHSSIP